MGNGKKKETDKFSVKMVNAGSAWRFICNNNISWNIVRSLSVANVMCLRLRTVSLTLRIDFYSTRRPLYFLFIFPVNYFGMTRGSVLRRVTEGSRARILTYIPHIHPIFSEKSQRNFIGDIKNWDIALPTHFIDLSSENDIFLKLKIVELSHIYTYTRKVTISVCNICL